MSNPENKNRDQIAQCFKFRDPNRLNKKGYLTDIRKKYHTVATEKIENIDRSKFTRVENM